MNYFPMLSEEDKKLICENFPLDAMRVSFKKHARDFNKLLPGHRPQNITIDKGRKLLADNLESKLVINMIGALVDCWMERFTSRIKIHLEKGCSKEEAIIRALPLSISRNQVKLFLRLSEESCDDNYINAISAAVKIISEDIIEKTKEKTKLSTDELEKIKSENKKFKDDVKKQTEEIKGLIKENNSLKSNNQTLNIFLSEKDDNIVKLKQDIKNLESKNKEFDNVILKSNNKIKILEKEKEQMSKNFADEKNNVKQKDVQIKELQKINDDLSIQLNKLKEETKHILTETYIEEDQICVPDNIDEFDEYLRNNLESIGLYSSSDYYEPMIQFLEKFLFTGKPIICNSLIGNVLAKCLSNALVGTSKVAVLHYSNNITASDIRRFLNTDSRILILEDFLGNFDDIELLPIVKYFSKKIIFLTMEYDKTAAYLPEEIFGYCHYFNFNHVSELFLKNEITEEPSKINEIIIKRENKQIDKRSQRLFTEIACQLGFSQFVVNSNLSGYDNETTMAQALLFSIIPLSIEIFETKPFELSKRLVKYAGESGDCKYKDLISRWFGYDE